MNTHKETFWIVIGALFIILFWYSIFTLNGWGIGISIIGAIFADSQLKREAKQKTA
jgi:hypothetical protein